MTRQGDGNSLGQQSGHGDALRFHLFVEGIELVGGDGVADAEAGHSKAGFHVAVDRSLQSVERNRLTRTTEAVAGGSARRRSRTSSTSHNGSRGALAHTRHAHRATRSTLNVFGLDATVRAATAQRRQLNAHLGGQLLGPRTGDHTSIGSRCCRRRRWRDGSGNGCRSSRGHRGRGGSRSSSWGRCCSSGRCRSSGATTGG